MKQKPLYQIQFTGNAFYLKKGKKKALPVGMAGKENTGDFEAAIKKVQDNLKLYYRDGKLSYSGLMIRIDINNPKSQAEIRNISFLF